MSGTPAPNRAHELFSVLNFISPIDFTTKKYFNEYYCGMTYDFMNGWGWVNGSAESKLEELYHKIAPFTHRVKKEDALKDLPDKTYQKLMIDMSDVNQKLYEEIEKGVVNEFLLNPTSNPLTIMLRLRQFTSSMKFDEVIELIETILESGEKVVIVDVFKESLIKFKEKYGNLAVLHTGDYSPEQRSEMVNVFQDPNSDVKLYLGTIQTCNYGLTLTAASKMIILTLPFSVGQYDQVADRLHRIGQKDAVNIYVPAFIETIDEYVYGTIESKRKELTKVMDNIDYESDVTESVVGDVMNIIKNKYKK
jgi:SWI/SNF-related matrix-associated actin-dependent regulator 1 of chromatin subfamily A